MFGFSIAQVVIALVGIVSVVGGGFALVTHFENEGERKIEAKYAPMVAVCPDATGFFGGKSKASPEDCAAYMSKGAEALVVNVKLQGDFDRLSGERDACTKAVEALQTQGARAKAAAAARKPADDAKLAPIAVEMQALIEDLPKLEALGLAPKLSCEQRLARRDQLWAKVAKEQERDFPPAAGAPAPANGLRLAPAVTPPVPARQPPVNPLRAK